MSRTSQISRSTGETDITVSLTLDGTGQGKRTTGVGFYDHMLDAFARHGLFDLAVAAEGDIEIDAHHTVEDVGLALGMAFKQALGERRGIVRYGTHRQHAAMMTCFAPSPAKPNHVHFIDGAMGGYAIAASALKSAG